MDVWCLFQRIRFVGLGHTYKKSQFYKSSFDLGEVKQRDADPSLAI